MKIRWKTRNKSSVLYKTSLGIPVIAWFGLTIVFYCCIIVPEVTKNDNLLKAKLKYTKGEDIIFDDIPRPSVKQCETIHIAIKCEQPRNVTTMLMSLLHHRQNPLHLHLIVDDLTEHKVQVLFSSWGLPNIKYTYYNVDKLLHHAISQFGRKGIATLLLPDILPTIRVIVLDTDLTILCDVYELWEMFRYMSSTQFLGLVEYQGSLSKEEATNWPAMAHYNTGVMLLDLKKLQRETWFNIWRDTFQVIQKKFSKDLCVVNGVIRTDVVYDIFCHYNLQMPVVWKAKHCYGQEVRNVKIIHWNTRRKDDDSIKNEVMKSRLRPDLHYFRTIRRLYLEQGDVKLQRKLSGCSTKLGSSEIDESDVCANIYAMRTAKFLTHIYYMPYNYWATENDITLVVQLSRHRLPVLLRLCKQWEGPVSVAIYLHYCEGDHLEQFINHSSVLRARTNIGYHVVFEQTYKHYPINYLRNVALENVNTPYVFLMDVDFVPMVGLYEHLKTAVRLINPDSQKKCIVVPAFQTNTALNFPPLNKQHLLAELHKSVFPFKLVFWEYGHRATNYQRWSNATTSYEVEWELGYEPYVVVPRFVTKFDTRFSGYGFNRVPAHF